MHTVGKYKANVNPALPVVLLSIKLTGAGKIKPPPGWDWFLPLRTALTYCYVFLLSRTRMPVRVAERDEASADRTATD